MKRVSLFCIIPILLSACGQEVLVFDGIRYGPNDPIVGLLPGDPAGDRIDVVGSSSSCSDLQLALFPDTLTDEQTIGLFVPRGCSIILRTDDHEGLSSQDVTYRTSWLGAGYGTVTPIVADATNNTDASIQFEANLVRYSPLGTTPAGEIPADVNARSHRVSMALPRRLGHYDVRVDGFEDSEVEPGFTAAEFRLRSPDVSRPYVAGIRIDASSSVLGPIEIRDGYIISDLRITHGRN